jgi:alpha-L-fucosidase
VYVHVLDWPRGTVVLPPIERKIVSSSVLTGGTATVRQSAERIEIVLPEAHWHPIDTIVALELDGPAGGLKPGRLASGSVATGKPARASNTFENRATYAPAKALDDDPDTRWGCDWGTKSAWLEVDLGKPTTIGRAVISEPYGRVKMFALEMKDGDVWRPFAKATTIGERRVLTFKPVTARLIRLNLLRCTEGPSIWEFQLFPPEK